MERREPRGITLENGAQIRAFGKFGVLGRTAGDILQNTEKQHSCTHGRRNRSVYQTLWNPLSLR